MGAQEFRRSLSLVERSDDLHRLDHALWVVTAVIEEAHAQPVGLGLVVSAVLHVDELANQGGHLRRRHAAVRVIGIAGRYHCGAGKSLGELSFGNLLGRMAGYDMPCLVTQHTGQLAIGLQLIIERASDEDLPAGKGKGVFGLGVGQQVEVKLVRGGAQLAIPGQFAAQSA